MSLNDAKKYSKMYVHFLISAYFYTLNTLYSRYEKEFPQKK